MHIETCNEIQNNIISALIKSFKDELIDDRVRFDARRLMRTNIVDIYLTIDNKL